MIVPWIVFNGFIGPPLGGLDVVLAFLSCALARGLPRSKDVKKNR